MALSEKNIEEFQKLYKEHFGKEISREEALENGMKLLQLISILYRPPNNKVDITK